MKKIGIFIASEQKGFLIALADQIELLYNFKVVIIARDKYVAELAHKILPKGSSVTVVDHSKSIVSVPLDSALNEATRIEGFYGVKIAMLLSEDRALGQGYLSNVQKIPDIKRASWAYNKKIQFFVRDFIKTENILNGLDFIIQLWPNKIRTSICRKAGVKSLSFTAIKFGDRMFWSDDDYITSRKYIERVKKNSLNIDKKDIPQQYEIDGEANRINKKVKYSYVSAFKEATKTIINDSKNFIRGINKKDSYHYLGWLPSNFRKIKNYKYVKNNSVTYSDVLKQKIVYFTLHLEPEVALQQFSPEFGNSMEAIIWLSKSLPVNYILVVKEQVYSYGVRSKWYYNQLIKIPNVVLAHPDTDSWKWIELSEIVATITGTVGQEAVHFEKPVISFGKHQIINHLPTVFFVSNYFETEISVNKIIKKPLSKVDYHQSRVALLHAQLESSIDIPEYKDAFKSVKLEASMAVKALHNMSNEHPELLPSEDVACKISQVD